MAEKVMARDGRIMCDVYLHQYMTSTQIRRLHFPGEGKVGPQKACERRLRFQVDAGYLRRIVLPSYREPGRQPFVYAVAQRGAQVVADLLDLPVGEIDVRPRDLEGHYPFLMHLLATNDFYVSLTHACKSTGVNLVKWVTERELRRQRQKQYVQVPVAGGGYKPAALIPDGLFIVEQIVRNEPLKSVCFLEVDQKTVVLAPADYTTRSWAKKVAVYRAYFASEAYRREFGALVPRVVAVTLGRERLHNMLAATLDAGGNYQFWFSDQADACDPHKLLTGEIWAMAGDIDAETEQHRLRGLLPEQHNEQVDLHQDKEKVHL